MADDSEATQLLLFEACELFEHTADNLPTSWKASPDSLAAPPLIDFRDVHPWLVAPHGHRDLKAQQEQEKRDAIVLLALKTGKPMDTIEMAYVCFANGDLRFEIFQRFETLFRLALKANILDLWLTKVQAEAMPKRKARVVPWGRAHRNVNR